MKNNILFLLFALLISSVASLSMAQVSQTSFLGKWKINPMNDSHPLSRLTIVDNGPTVSITLKKKSLKKYPGKYDPQERKLYFTVDGVDYFLVFVPANGSLMGYKVAGATKFADYIK